MSEYVNFHVKFSVTGRHLVILNCLDEKTQIKVWYDDVKHVMRMVVDKPYYEAEVAGIIDMNTDTPIVAYATCARLVEPENTGADVFTIGSGDADVKNDELRKALAEFVCWLEMEKV